MLDQINWDLFDLLSLVWLPPSVGLEMRYFVCCMEDRDILIGVKPGIGE